MRPRAVRSDWRERPVTRVAAASVPSVSSAATERSLAARPDNASSTSNRRSMSSVVADAAFSAHFADRSRRRSRFCRVLRRASSAAFRSMTSAQ